MARFTVFILSCLNVSVYTTSVCAPIQEGGSLTLTCSGSTHKPERIVHWKKRTGIYGLETNVVDCYSHGGSTSCESPVDVPYVATIKNAGFKFSSSLVIPNISIELDGYTFLCHVFDLKHTTHLYSCEVDVYRKPGVVSCDVLPVEGVINQAIVKCYARDVHPVMRCDVDESETNSSILSVTYAKNCTSYKGATSPVSKSEKLHCWHSCSMKFQLPGVFLPRIHVQVNTVVDGDDQPDTTVVTVVGPVNMTRLSSLPMLTTASATIDLCDELTTKRLTTRVKFLSEEPRFLWCLLHGEGTDLLMEEVIPLKNTTRASSTLELSLSNLTHIKALQNPTIICGITPVDQEVKGHPGCELLTKHNANKPTRRNNQNSDSYGFLFGGESDSADVATDWLLKYSTQVRFPPQEAPKFTDSKEDFIDRSVELIEGSITPIRCQVVGGQPKVKTFHVTCTSSQSVILLEKVGSGADIVFSLPGQQSFNDSHCVCRAQHVTECYDMERSLSIVVVPTTTQSTTTSYMTDNDSPSTILTVIVGLLTSLCLSLLVITLMRHFHSRKWLNASCKKRGRKTLGLNSVSKQNLEYSHENQGCLDQDDDNGLPQCDTLELNVYP